MSCMRVVRVVEVSHRKAGKRFTSLKRQRRSFWNLQSPPHELFPWEYAMKHNPPKPPASLLDARGVVSAALCVATGLSCNGDSLARFTYATSMDASSP